MEGAAEALPSYLEQRVRQESELEDAYCGEEWKIRIPYIPAADEASKAKQMAE